MSNPQVAQVITDQQADFLEADAPTTPQESRSALLRSRKANTKERDLERAAKRTAKHKQRY